VIGSFELISSVFQPKLVGNYNQENNMVSILYLFTYLGVAAVAFEAKPGSYQHQSILMSDDSFQQNFIATSIFGQRLVDRQLAEPLALLPPRFSSRNFDDDYPYEGIGTFAHLEYVECTESKFDIGIVGHPFDLGVSYRPGARFGPSGGRNGARRLSPAAGWECVTCIVIVHEKLLIVLLLQVWIIMV
jgi:hypothetical protein